MRKLVSSNMMIGDEEVNIDAYAEYSVDNRYGEDADGNRGVQRTEVEQIVDLNAYKLNGEDVTLSAKDKQRAEDILTRRFFEGD